MRSVQRLPSQASRWHSEGKGTIGFREFYGMREKPVAPFLGGGPELRRYVLCTPYHSFAFSASIQS
jgi:hypothetical protein